MKNTRKVIIEYTEDYGGKGNRAWLINEFYNGEKTHQGHKVAKREYFSDLHIICQEYIKEGYTIEMKVAEGEVVTAPSERLMQSY
jgi:hypothetical protein|tara:strand:- start:29080 stop:29334 length:255 start_codon:yes stop_codon:yes gene_type:complete